MYFFDDIKIRAETKQQHDKILRLVLERLGNAGLTIQLEKCDFAKNRIQYLGFDVDQNGLHISKDRIRALIDMKNPENLSELRSFIGLTNCY